jgi:DNA-binding response OmpR family regulator
VPVVAAILARAFLKEAIPPARLFGIGLSVLGVGLVSGAAPSGADPSGAVLLGDALTVGAVVAYGAYAVQGRALRSGEGHPAVVTTAASFAAGLLFLLPLAAGEAVLLGAPGLGAQGWIVVAYLGAVAFALPIFLWNYALGHVPASAAAVYINLVPVVGLASALLVGERVGAVRLVGGTLTVAGCCFSRPPCSPAAPSPYGVGLRVVPVPTQGSVTGVKIPSSATIQGSGAVRLICGGTMTIRALIVEDEQNLVGLLRLHLEREGFEVHEALDGRAALEVARRVAPDVVVLDWMLPELGGMEVLRELRGSSDAYVIMLTARTDEVDRVVGLSTGADDYLTKPFSPAELVARIRAMLRRPRGAASATERRDAPLGFGDLTVDTARREARLGGEAVALTAMEFDLLATLASEPGIVFGRDRLLEKLWGGDYFGSDHVIDVHVANVRKKLGDDPQDPRYVQTVRGVGYRFRLS